MNCQTCNDPTKYIFALWDGPNGTHGKAFECHNLNCELKQSRLRGIVIAKEEQASVVEANEINMIFMEYIKQKRKELQITISKMAKSLGISPSDYSNYEMCRVALPVEMSERINEVFKRGDG